MKKNIFLVIFLVSSFCFGRTFNNIYVMPQFSSQGNTPSWGPLNLAGGPNAITNRLAPAVQTFLSGSGTYGLSYYFLVVSANATSGATYTNSANTFTVTNTISAGTVLLCTSTGAPAASGTLTKASGTGDSTIAFTAITAPLYIELIMVGGGGGGAGSGVSGTGGNGTSGGNSTFGTSSIAAGGTGASGTSAGSGGTGSLGVGPGVGVGIALKGAPGAVSTLSSSASVNVAGGSGGATPLGGGGTVGTGTASANTGAGGGGASGSGNASGQDGGAGGGSGGYVNGIFSSPAATYTYAVGTAGGGGAAGTSGNAGQAGSAGLIFIKEHFQ